MACSLSIQVFLLALGFLQGVSGFCAEDESCVHFPVVHSSNKNVFPKRAVEVQLANRSDISYYAQLNIGTPAQEVFVQLDTGSFELWVNPTCTDLSLSDSVFCDATGSFETSKSSTAVNTNTAKTLSYGIGSANITYFKDSIALPGAARPMTGVQFGVATASVDEFSGIMGVGYGYGLTTSYPNFVDELALQNQTSVKAFSVGLGSKAEQEGAIVFGGVDTSKFAGTLATLPIVPAADSPDGVPRYWIAMNNMSLTTPNGVTKPYPNTGMDVFLDTGATLSLFPPELTTAIATDFGSPTADSDGYYQVDCSYNDMNGTVNFAFNGVTIKVPYSELIRESSSGAGRSCMLGVGASSTFTLLGDTFLRAAYAVFDLDNNAIHMQQYINCGSTPAAVTDSSMFNGLEGKCSTSDSSGKANMDISSGQVTSTISSVVSSTTATATSTHSAASTAASTTDAAATGSTTAPNSSTMGSSSAAASTVVGLSPLGNIVMAITILLILN
ncbi:unnamed protein product [Discula destructiva]